MYLLLVTRVQVHMGEPQALPTLPARDMAEQSNASRTSTHAQSFACSCCSLLQQMYVASSQLPGQFKNAACLTQMCCKHCSSCAHLDCMFKVNNGSSQIARVTDDILSHVSDYLAPQAMTNAQKQATHASHVYIPLLSQTCEQCIFLKLAAWVTSAL